MGTTTSSMSLQPVNKVANAVVERLVYSTVVDANAIDSHPWKFANINYYNRTKSKTHVPADS